MRRKLLVFAMLVLLGGCDKLKTMPVDLQDSPLVGTWYAEDSAQASEGIRTDRLLVQIAASGYVRYHYLGCDQRVGLPLQEKRLDLLDMPIKRLTTVKMVLQNYPLTPKYELTIGSWPDKNNGVFTLDGLSLRRVEPADVLPPALWDCAFLIRR